MVGRLALVARMPSETKSSLVIHSPDKEWQKYSEALKKALLEVDVLRSHAAKKPEAQNPLLSDMLWRNGNPEENSDSAVIGSYQMLITDEILMDKIKTLVFEDALDATSAVIQAFQDVRSVVQSMENQYLREKSLDLDACEDLLLSALNNSENLRQKQWAHLQGRIVVIQQPTPQDMIRLHQVGVAGIVAENGSRLSHAAILARSFNIPTLFSTAGIVESARNGQKVILDADSGRVTLNPSRSEQRKAEARRAVELLIRQKLKAGALTSAKTTDGRQISILANADGPFNGKALISSGAEGIGLLRTEFLHLREPDSNGTPETPSEIELECFFKLIAESMQPGWATVRLLDCGGDKPYPPKHQLSQNDSAHLSGSVFGIRGIRFLLAEKEILKTQLRALIKANRSGNIRILIPYVTEAREVRQVKHLLQSLWKELPENERTALHFPLLGAMVETPSAVLMLDQIASECDFLSVGSNDLTQHILCIERGQSHNPELCSSFHPAVLRALKNIVDARTQDESGLGLCGEIASDPVATELLLGLGFIQISCRAATIPLIKAIVRNTNCEEAKRMAQHLLQMSSAEEVSAFLLKRYREKHSQLDSSTHSNERAS